MVSYTDQIATVTKKGLKQPERKAAAKAFVDTLSAPLDQTALFSALEENLKMNGNSGVGNRAGALFVINELVTKFGETLEVSLVNLLATIIDLTGDKKKPVATAAEASVEAVFAMSNKWAMNAVLEQLTVRGNSWKANLTRLSMIERLAEKYKLSMGAALPTIIPDVTNDIHDIKPEVGEQAKKTLKALCGVCQNVDVIPIIPTLLGSLIDTDNIGDSVFELASTTFVEIVDQASLAIISPILLTGFKGRDTKIKRSCARIVDNMTTLVEDSRDVAPFVTELMPLMEAAAKNIPNPEYREVCSKAIKTLSEKADLPPNFNMVEMKEVLPIVEAAAKEAKVEENPRATATLKYIAEMVCSQNFAGENSEEATTALVLPYLKTITSDDAAAAVAKTIVAKASRENADTEEEYKEENAEELCNCDFSLAYGNKVLLKKTRLRLHRGMRYGLIGKNDCGKTSLMRAIAEYRVEGFPEEHELRTIFVETDIKAEFADMNIVDYMFEDPLLASLNLSREKIIETLEGFGFVEGSPASIRNTCGSLSGGWRMKLALSRAMLLNADILLLDEPTNHLDTYNVKWVEDYLMSLDDVTSIMVSHDSGLLDRVCTNMIEIKSYKLSFYKGNLSAFVAKNPSAKAYFELKSEKIKFSFPQPGPLEGVTSKGKAIMKMNDISFTYPGADKAQLNHVTVQVSLGSRVACVGVNGAGKSTMIKLLTGELEPDAGSGKVWTHPNCRIGYIAQHAFHHINQHLHISANDYVKWRYANGNDREENNKITNKVTPEEQAKMEKPIEIMREDPDTGARTKQKIKIGRLTEGRRTNKVKQDQEYEVTIAGTQTMVWVLRKDLLKNGWEKVLNQVDSRIATRAAMYSKPLTTNNVMKHFEDVGLEEEFSTHVRMASLSGGQKVKVVLGAAMWNRPHILILDEPTNYLDRESLGALAQAIREFEGGVVMITHNSQFCDNLCPTVWHLQNNTLDVKGDAEWMKEMGMTAVKETKQEGEMVDKYGNTVTLKKDIMNIDKKVLKKRLKQRAKMIKQALKKGKPEPEFSDDEEMLELELAGIIKDGVVV